MSGKTLQTGMGRALAGPSNAWLSTQLPPILVTICTDTGRELDVRLVGPGQNLGASRTLPDDATPLLEVRRRDRLSAAFGLGGDVVACWDLTGFLTAPLECWQILEDGMTYACPPDQLHLLYDAVIHAVTGHRPVRG
jgi:hypothetical protein